MYIQKKLVVCIICLILTCFAVTEARPSIPYIASDDDAVRDMLSIANVGPGDVVYDLGSGDGRIPISAVRDFKASRAVGLEIDAKLVGQSRKNAKKAGLADKVKFIQGDLFKKDFSKADVVTLFLGHQPNITLRPKIFSTLKPGARIVSHQFNMGEWKPDKTLSVRKGYFGGMYGTIENPYADNPLVPDYDSNESTPLTDDKIFMWTVPAQAAGIWHGKIKTEKGLKDYKLTLYQYLSEINATLHISGQPDIHKSLGTSLLGDQIELSFVYDKYMYKYKFDGHVKSGAINGTLSIWDNGTFKDQTWKAKRQKTDFSGTWQWPCATGHRMVKLSIKEDKGRLSATYIDKDKETPVTDFYDFGGGFYFTLMIGRKGYSTVLNEDTGWLIGYAVADQGKLKGKIQFFPYNGKSPLKKDWTPELLKE